MADGAGRQMQFRSRGLKRIATTCCFEHAQLRRSEVAIAPKARSLLQSEGVPTAVVSMPCWELFDEQPEHYRRRVIDRAPYGSRWKRPSVKDGIVTSAKTAGLSA
jgi:hypothetical protein